MNVIDALNWRYAVKTFSNRKLQPWQLEKLLEAARLSPSSYGLQPYRIIVVESASLRERLLPHAYSQVQVVSGSHLLVFAARTDIGPNLVTEYVELASKNQDTPAESLTGFATMAQSALGAMTPGQSIQWAHQQAFVALGNMLTSAAMMQIDTCPIGGFEPQAFDRILGLKDKQLTTSVICPIGFRDPQDKYAHRRKVRVDQKHMVLEM